MIIMKLLTWWNRFHFRHAAVMETSVKSCCSDCDSQEEDKVAFLNQDLSMLRIIETFSESAPQIVLMLAVLLQDGSLEPFQGSHFL